MIVNLSVVVAIDNRRCWSWVNSMILVRIRGIAATLCAVAAVTVAPRNAPAQVSSTQPSEESLSRHESVAVKFRGRDLFEVRAPIGTLHLPERARAIEERLGSIAAGSADALEAISVLERDRSSDLMAGSQLVLSVTDGDAAPLGRTRQQLAADYSERLHAALREEFSGRSVRGIGLAVALAVLATALLLAAWRTISTFARRFESEARRAEGSRIPALRFKGIELASASRMTAAAVQLLRIAQWVLVTLSFVVYVESVLGFFPWTRAAALQFRGYVGGALSTFTMAIVGYLPNLIYIAIIIVLVRLILRAADFVFHSLGNGHLKLRTFRPEWAAPTDKIARFLIIAFAVVVIFPYLPGAESPAFRGVSIFLGVLFSLGSSSAVSNVVAGIVMTYMIPFRPGDRVKIGETVGDVIESNLLVVRIRTIKNVDVTIPNSSVLGGHIVNYTTRSREDGLILHSTVTIGYDAPWRTVHELLVDAARQTEGILQQPSPFVLQTSLDDFYVSYEINAYTDQPNRMAVIYGDLHQHIQDVFAAAGVEIMSPHYQSLRDGQAVTLPPDHLPRNYESPPFRVEHIHRDVEHDARG
ncbi:MAG: mechanosensitive ion channel family protein [Gemmatimonadaceae bacterium]